MPEQAQETTWKVTLLCTRAEAEALTEDSLFVASTDSVPTIVTREDNPNQPDQWAIDVYCQKKPNAELLRNIAKLAPISSGKPTVEKLGDEDWVTMSQQGLEPLRAGRFFVHTSNDKPMVDPAICNIKIDASQAFGTGHHETTLGCMETLDSLRKSGHRYRNIIDVGTGTGLLAFAANHLWPNAKILASDIDQIAVDTCKINAKENGVSAGRRRGAIRFLRSNGLDHNSIKRRAPYDLIIANILAGPLTALAPQIAAASKAGTTLILAGLLTEQKPAIVLAYMKAGFRLRHMRLENEWPCLTLIKKREYGRKRGRLRERSPLADDYFGEC